MLALRAGMAAVGRTVERRATGAARAGMARGGRGTGPSVGGRAAGRHGDKPPQQRNGGAYTMRTMAKTNAKTNVTSIITAPEKRKTSESSITRLSA